MSTKTYSIALVVLLGWTLPLGAVEQSDVVGTWQLARVDGIELADVPPGSFPKLVVELGDAGRSRHWIAGEEEASEGRYSIDDGELSGWIGLSNDLETPRPLEIPAEGWLEISFPEGFVATFERVSPGHDVEPGCAFFTIAGVDYDPEQVAEIKQATFDFQPGPVPSRLMGRWTAVRGAPQGGSVEIDLTIRDGSAHLVIRNLEPPSEPFIDSEAEIEVSGEYLRSPAIACGAVHHFSVDRGVLEMVVSAEPPIRLGPAGDGDRD